MAWILSHWIGNYCNRMRTSRSPLCEGRVEDERNPCICVVAIRLDTLVCSRVDCLSWTCSLRRIPSTPTPSPSTASLSSGTCCTTLAEPWLSMEIWTTSMGSLFSEFFSVVLQGTILRWCPRMESDNVDHKIFFECRDNCLQCVQSDCALTRAHSHTQYIHKYHYIYS